MLILLKCLGILIAGLLIAKILVGLADIDSKKQQKKLEEHYKILEDKRKAEYEALLKEAERDAEIEKKLEEMKNKDGDEK